MPLLNYTTQVPAARTVAEIQGMLACHGARAILTEYDTSGEVSGLSFEIVRGQRTLQFRVPVKPDTILRVLQRQKDRNYRLRRTFSRPQAVMIAWRIAKDWTEAQLALLDTEMVELEQIFLPYLILDSGQTLYDGFREAQYQLPAGPVG